MVANLAYAILGQLARLHYSVAMPLIIDGYNVLHESDKPSSLAGLDEALLCAALARSDLRSQCPVVVCDGRPKPLGFTESPSPGVSLIYSGPSRSADDVIIAMIEADSAPRRLIVASSDRVIRRAARRRRATSWTSVEFLRHLAGALGGGPPPTDKPDVGNLSPEQVRHWLEQFGVDEDTAGHDLPA